MQICTASINVVMLTAGHSLPAYGRGVPVYFRRLISVLGETLHSGLYNNAKRKKLRDVEAAAAMLGSSGTCLAVACGGLLPHVHIFHTVCWTAQ